MSRFRHFITSTAVLAALAPLASGIQAAATVNLASVPPVLVPGQTATVTVNFTKLAGEPEKRVVALLELFKVGVATPVAKGVADNSTNGYTGNSGNIPVSLAVPGNASGAYYFKGWVVPWSMNRQVVAQYKTYPYDGTFTYLWSGGGHGVTQNIYYLGTLISPKPAGNTTYCSGLAYDCAITAFNNYNSQYGHPYIGTINSSSKMVDFRLLWYGARQDKEYLAALAVPQYQAGLRITDFEEAQEGDFVQLWRHSGSGHNPLFVSWRRSQTTGQITGVNYWGSQGSTNGIGYSYENFGTTSGMNRDRFHLARFRKPRDAADYTWALGSADTSGSPSTAGVSSVEHWTGY